MIGGGIAGIIALQAAGCFDSKTEEYGSVPDYEKLITRYRNGEWHWRTAGNMQSATAENPGYLECSGCIGGGV